jgi:hypothetical protein
VSTPAPARHRVLPGVIQAAVALAAVYFPAGDCSDGVALTTRRMTCFVLDGHLDAWSGWQQLPAGDARRFGRLLRRRPSQVANAEVAGPELDRLLMTNELPGCAPASDYAETGIIIVSPGMPLTDFADACLDELEALHRGGDRFLRPAAPGPHHTTLRVPVPGGTAVNLADAHYDIRPHHVTPPPQAPAILDAAPRPELRVPLAELLEVAAALDTAHGAPAGQGYRAAAVSRFIRQARGAGGAPVDALNLSAGTLNELIAYTGFGKSVVLVETLACWAARHGIVVTFVVPTNADVVRYAFQIEQSLAQQGSDIAVTPLMSPRSVFTVADTSAHRVTPHGPDAGWIWSRLGYGCALAAAASTEDQVDAWQPGHEPCASLRPSGAARLKRDRVVACPWRMSCDKFALARAACTAGIIVTSHANLLAGRLQLPVDDGQGVTDGVSVEELVLRRSHMVVIDEIDSFQRTALDQSGRGLVLDRAGGTDTPLRRFDAEFGAAFGRVHEEVDANVRDACLLTRFLSETYVSHLAYGRLGTSAADRRRPRGPSRNWVVPRRWDAWLTARLLGLNSDSPVTDEQLAMFQSLFAGQAPLDGEPAVFRQIRPYLRAVITNGTDGKTITDVRAELDHLLEGVVTRDRDTVINRMLRRAILEQIRVFLHRLMASSPQLVAAGVESTQEIADALGPYGRWRVTPTGPLGRLVFAFTEHHDDTGAEPARLSTAAFGGDPHVHTVSLGDTTALALAGTRRVVLGLSATAYFPYAPRHHVHAEPRWWVSDDNPGTVTIEPAPVAPEDQSAIKVSGLTGAARSDATRQLARLLWTRRLSAELQQLRRDDPARARVLLATTSYDGARHVAEGLALAGVAPTRICLAVRPRRDAPRNPGGQIVTDAGRWLELPADRLEDFPDVRSADILIAPLARVQRGVNIIGEGDRSALGSVWLIVRPIPVIDEPSELVAHIQARALAENRGPAADPLAVLRGRRDTAGRYFEDIVRRPPYFQSQPREVKLSVTAEIINDAIQLIGRARRGGTPAVLHLVDGAFLDPQGGTDFATLIAQLRDAWASAGVLDSMRYLYGTTLEAFFSYADQNALAPQPGPARSGGPPC